MSAANNFNFESKNWVGNLNITGYINPSGGIYRRITSVTGVSPYTIIQSDDIVEGFFATGTTGTVILPSGTTFNGKCIVIKDGSGNASLSSFVVSGQPNIDGTGSYQIIDDYGSLTVYKGTNGWRII